MALYYVGDMLVQDSFGKLTRAWDRDKRSRAPSSHRTKAFSVRKHSYFMSQGLPVLAFGHLFQIHDLLITLDESTKKGILYNLLQ